MLQCEVPVCTTALIFMLVSLSFFTVETDLTPRDPNWIGAWWIGFVLLALIMLVWAVPTILFPARLPGQPSLQNEEKGFKEMAKGIVSISFVIYHPTMDFSGNILTLSNQYATQTNTPQMTILMWHIIDFP